MIRVFAANNVLFIGFAQYVEVPMYQLQLGIIGFRARIGKKGMVEAVGCDFYQFTGELYRRLIRAPKEVVVER